MKKIRLSAIVLVLALSLSLLAGCGGQGSAAPSSASLLTSSQPVQSTPQESAPTAGITIVDMKGREVTLAGPAQRVVALAAADCEIVCALGGLDTLVGRGSYCDWPAEVLAVEAVDSGTETNIEQIIALDPDVVFMATMNQKVEQVEQLEAAGIAVIAIEAFDIAGVYECISLIGTVLGKEAEAGELVAQMMQELEALQAAVPAAEGDKKTVYFEVSPLEWGLWAAGSNTFMDEIATLLGLENCFADLAEWAEVSQEQVLQRNPDYIVSTANYFGEGPTPDEEIMGREGWQVLAAVQESQVLSVPNNELTRPGPRLVEGARMMFEFIYGEAALSAAA